MADWLLSHWPVVLVFILFGGVALSAIALFWINPLEDEYEEDYWLLDGHDRRPANGGKTGVQR